MKRTYFYIPTLALMLTGCFDEIQLDLPDDLREKVVIEGVVQKTDETILVRYSAATPSSASVGSGVAEKFPVTDAYLIIDGIAFPQYQLENDLESELALSLFEPEVSVRDGSGFRLAVTLQDGRSYLSSEELLYPVADLRLVDVTVDSREEPNSAGNLVSRRFVELRVTSSLLDKSGQRAFLKWETDGVYRFVEAPPPEGPPFLPQRTCYVTRDVGNNNVVVFNGRKSDSDEIIRFKILEEPRAHEFAYGFLISVFQQSLSPSAFAYWDQVQRNNDQTGGIFDAVPGPVISNIRNTADPAEEVSGFFYVTQADTIRRLVRPEEADRPLGFCALEANATADICQDCRLIRNSTTIKPSYWDE